MELQQTRIYVTKYNGTYEYKDRGSHAGGVYPKQCKAGKQDWRQLEKRTHF